MAIAKELKENLSHLQFRREIVQILFGKAPDKTIRPDYSGMPVDGTRFGGVFYPCEPAEKQGSCKKCKKYHLHLQGMQCIAPHNMC